MTEQTPDVLADLIARALWSHDNPSNPWLDDETHLAHYGSLRRGGRARYVDRAARVAAVVRASGTGLGGTSREEWPGGDPAECGCGNPDAHRGPDPAPDGTTDLRAEVEHLACLVENWRNDSREETEARLTAEAERDAARAEVTFWQSAMQAHADCDARDAALDAARAEVAALRAAQPGREQVARVIADARRHHRGIPQATGKPPQREDYTAADAVLALFRQDQP